jgi:CHAT domain-containing protein/tetratricopeptide (TPR) repeat protein
MTESSLVLARKLARSANSQQAMGLLVAAPILSFADLIEAARNPLQYGIPADEARNLQALEPWLAGVLLAFTGKLDPAVPASIYAALAMTSRLQRKWDQARSFYQYSFMNAKTVEEKAKALSGTGLLHLQLNKLDKARKVFGQAQTLCEDSGVGGRTLAFILVNAGTVEMEDKQWTDAGKQFEKARSIGFTTRLPDVYALARINQAELARRQGDLAQAASYLDDIRWIEGSGMAEEPSYQALRRRVAGQPLEAGQDYGALSIEELEQLLLNPASFDVGTDLFERAMAQKTLGDKYFARSDGQRIENVQTAIGYWESALDFIENGKIGDKAVLEIGDEETAHVMDADLHRGLGLAYNEWSALERSRAPWGKARQHFEQALRVLPQTKQFEPDRRGLLNYLANALAYDAQDSPEAMLSGEPDRQIQLLSLDVQAELARLLKDDPSARCLVLMNMAQTYGDLAARVSGDKDVADSSYQQAACDCVEAAANTLNAIPDPNPELVLGVIAKKAQAAAELGLPPEQLAQLQEQLDPLLRRENLAGLQPRTFAFGFRQSARLARLLGQKALCYRRLLQAMRLLRHRMTGVRAAFEDNASELLRTNSDLLRAMVDWKDFERAAYFAGTSPLHRSRECAPGRRWKTPGDSAAVLFDTLSTSRMGAFVLTPTGIGFRDLSVTPRELERIAAAFLSARLDSQDGATPSEENPAWLSAVEQCCREMGEKLFQPILDLLPASGSLRLIPTHEMFVLPLQLAALSPSELLLDRFEVTWCSELSYAGAEPAGPQPEGVFIATYSPPSMRLPFAALEARAVAGNYPSGVQVAAGPNATPERVCQGLRESRSAHLCCHGSFDRKSPLDSRLVFGDPNAAERDLTVRAIELSLAQSPCELIVLSACEAGSRDTGAREPSDFSSVLLHAGCENVIAALWRIDDLSTTILMGQLHAALANGAGAAAALAAAQRSMKTQPGEAMAARARGWLSLCAAELSPEENAFVTQKLDALAKRPTETVFAHPAYWGPFSVNAKSCQLIRGLPSR